MCNDRCTIRNDEDGAKTLITVESLDVKDMLRWQE